MLGQTVACAAVFPHNIRRYTCHVSAVLHATPVSALQLASCPLSLSTAESLMTRTGVFERQAVLFTIVTEEISRSLNVRNYPWDSVL